MASPPGVARVRGSKYAAQPGLPTRDLYGSLHAGLRRRPPPRARARRRGRLHHDVALPGPGPAGGHQARPDAGHRRRPQRSRSRSAPPSSGPGRATRSPARSTATPVTVRAAGCIDPIDGTKNFVRGVPVWATLIALMDGDDVVAGVGSAPALGRRWWAAVGHRRLHRQEPVLGRDRLAVSEVTDLSDASLSFSSSGGWEDSGLRRSVPRADEDGVAQPGLRRLLVLHARRRGRRRHRRASRR